MNASSFQQNNTNSLNHITNNNDKSILSNSQVSLIAGSVDKQLQRILNPSESTKELLENDFKHKIDQIEQSLTSRSNFLSLFQQMLQEEISRNKLQTEKQQSEHKLAFSNRDESDLQTYRMVDCKNERKNDQIPLRINFDVNATIQQRQNLQSLESESRICSESQQETKKVENKQQFKQIFKAQGIECQSQTDQYSTQDIFLPICFPSSLQKSICIQTIKKQLTFIKQDNNRLKFYIGEVFNFLKSFLIDQIFKKGLLSIVEVIEANYERKYLQQMAGIQKYRAEIDRNSDVEIKRIREQCEREVDRVNCFGKKNASHAQVNCNTVKIQEFQQNAVCQFDNTTSHIKQTQVIPQTDSQQLISFRPSSQISTQSQLSTYLNTVSNISIDSGNKLSRNANSFSSISIENTRLQNGKESQKSPLGQVDMNQQNPLQSQKCLNDLSAIMDIMKKMKFTLSVPPSFPLLPHKNFYPQHSSINRNEPTFITYDCNEFFYNGYVKENLFHGYGRLVLKNSNFTYEGEFQNHYMNGKGIVSIVLDQKIARNQKTTLVVRGNFASNVINGYGKISLKEQKQDDLTLMKDKLGKDSLNLGHDANVSQNINEVFGMWKNNQLIGIV